MPRLVAKPGRTKGEAPRRWQGHSVIRPVEVEDSDGRVGLEPLRFIVVHASQLAQQPAQGATAAPEKAAAAVTAHGKHVPARWGACEAEAAAAMAA